MKLRIRIIILIIAIFALITAFFFLFFGRNNTPKNEISNKELKEAKQDLSISILRYEEDLFSLDVNNLQQEIERLSEKYPPELLDIQIELLKDYLQDSVVVALYNDVKKAVQTDRLLKELETAFGYYKVFYPNDSIPKIITLFSDMYVSMSSVYIYDDILYINADLYLGANNPYYIAEGLPLYIAERCDPAYLPVDIFKKAVVFKHLGNAPRTTLLENMITEGKKLYFTEMMLPSLHERFIIGYSEEKYKWANNYMGNVWSYMIEKNELFGKGEALLRCYIEEAPFTKPFGNESPGRLGVFLGWKLIQSYMKNNPDVTLQELMKEGDYQKILNSARFKP